MITVEQIKQQYPYPVRFADSELTDRAYCIGGAICHVTGTHVNFPRINQLAIALIDLNPHLDWYDAPGYASLIITENDAGMFESAWETVNVALTCTSDVLTL